MRLSKAVVEQREAVVTKFFKENPKGTAQQAQDVLKASGAPGGMMRPGRVYELKKLAQAPVEAATNTTVAMPEPHDTGANTKGEPGADAAPAPVAPVVLNPLTGEPIEPVKV